MNADTYPSFAGLVQLKADGFLQELNRLVLHPAGRALGFTLDDTGRVLDVWVNPTSDPAGWGFVPAEDDTEFRANAANVAREIEALRQARLADPDLGSVVERVPGDGPCWETVTGGGSMNESEEALLSDLERVTAERDAARAEAEELRLTLAAEQGKPEGAPSEGWAFEGAAWHRWLRWVRRQGHGWIWYVYGPDETTIIARGEAPTARAAMLAADKATP